MLQDIPRLQQVVNQLLPKLHQATQYARLQKQLLLACVLLLSATSHAPTGLDKQPLKVHTTLSVLFCCSCWQLSRHFYLNPEVMGNVLN